MPETLPQWAWFVFYTGGSFGGWMMAGLVAAMVVKEFRFRRFMSRLDK
ncbi:MAG: hypothetical protein ABFD96_05840 [Armatimonadia bacterium]